ncbi:hypothetical protein ElyMa_003144500 [Elysia marginata]|uniref:Uncharacterized protein n=1 Tax=Elysia marginata TaxID=1093978 RepID=A0AAV4IT73_9GAST|nr:hypothetical protein ElyMa_003144500 [Elysia marginata]
MRNPSMHKTADFHDDQHDALRRTFLATGKGRRPMLPEVNLDNKLLLQLFSLKEESGCSWEKLGTWFLAIRPDVQVNRVRRCQNHRYLQGQTLQQLLRFARRNWSSRKLGEKTNEVCDLTNVVTVLQFQIKRNEENEKELVENTNMIEEEVASKMNDFDKEIKRIYCEAKKNIDQKKKELKCALKEKEKSLESLRKENENLTNKLAKQKEKLRGKGIEVASLKKENSDLLTKLSLSEDIDRTVDVKESTKNTYSSNMRQTVIAIMSNVGVSASNVKKCISIVSENLFDHKFKELPCEKSCLNMLDEAKVISNIQTAEEILSSSNATIHSDGTSRDQKKIVGHQVSLDTGTTLFMGFTPVASEDGKTLLDITSRLFQTLAQTYGDFKDISQEDVLKQLLSKVTSTMIDRAANMKNFDSKFQAFLSEELGREVQVSYLHYNAHFLLGIECCM